MVFDASTRDAVDDFCTRARGKLVSLLSIDQRTDVIDLFKKPSSPASQAPPPNSSFSPPLPSSTSSPLRTPSPPLPTSQPSSRSPPSKALARDSYYSSLSEPSFPSQRGPPPRRWQFVDGCCSPFRAGLVPPSLDDLRARVGCGIFERRGVPGLVVEAVDIPSDVGSRGRSEPRK